ncbi:Putative excinuclease ABC subunit C [Nostoc sp. DSM 114161]|jgi:group I intron endonuclease|uniref:GIY-YIG nuclease family protein n=1 Tax=Nostoc sp. DSM 114161 TaxID=3440143 RepID=UPI0040463CE6
MPKRKTQDEFIQQAQAKHDRFYDYGLVNYLNSSTKVNVICPEHGEFKITPSHHLGGVGCRKCFDDRARNTQEDIIARFRQAHGDRYGYDKVIYTRIDIKVVITCSIHGDFEQVPIAHINGSGCLKCFNQKQTLTKEEFIQKARAKHGDRYDYSQANYINIATKVTIICTAHGSFEQSPGNHLRGHRCPDCAKENVTEAQFGFEYKGVKYRSIKHACQELDKDYWTVVKRLELGWTLEQAFDDAQSNPRHPFKVNGVTYNGIEDAVRQLNAPVSSTTVKRRIAEGMKPEEALFTPPKLSYSNGVVYLIANLIDGKQYIGLTTTTLDERWKGHLEQVLRKDASLLHKAIASFGKENFTIEVIDSACSPKELRAKEREWIEKLNTLAPNGYNVSKGGEIGGSPGKPTRLPGAPILYPSVKAAAEALAKRENINIEAAEKRIYVGRINAKKPHGLSKTRIYKLWDYLVHGATNPKSRDYTGSTICERWKDFTNFYEDMGPTYQDGLRLKLIDPNSPYCPENCVWVNPKNKHSRVLPNVSSKLGKIGEGNGSFQQLTLWNWADEIESPR